MQRKDCSCMTDEVLRVGIRNETECRGPLFSHVSLMFAELSLSICCLRNS